MDLGIILPGIIIFFARIADVSIGTVRTISVIHGRSTVAFFLGFLEVSIWLVVVAAVLNKIMDQPILGVFYALGFAAGNLVGIKLEHYLALGHIVLRVISQKSGKKLAEVIRDKEFRVTTFQGEGKYGPVTELYIVCRRRDLKRLMPLITSIDPEAFYITEQAGTVSKVYRPFMTSATGWRAILKKK